MQFWVFTGKCFCWKLPAGNLSWCIPVDALGQRSCGQEQSWHRAILRLCVQGQEAPSGGFWWKVAFSPRKSWSQWTISSPGKHKFCDAEHRGTGCCLEMRWWACRLEPTRREASPGPGGGDLGEGEQRVRPTCPGSGFNLVPRNRLRLHACPTWQRRLLAFGLVACPPGLCLSLVTSPSRVQPGTSWGFAQTHQRLPELQVATSSPESTLVCSAGWTCGPALHFMPDVWSKIVLAKETPRGRLLEWGGTETQSGEKSGEGQKHRVVKRVGTDRNRVVKTAEDPQQQLCSTSHEKKLLDRNWALRYQFEKYRMIIPDSEKLKNWFL